MKAWRTAVLGDDLSCDQPFYEQVLAQGCAFIFFCQPDSHTLLDLDDQRYQGVRA